MRVIINNEALAATLGARAGDEIEVPTCKNGVPKNKEWRNRLEDSKIDNCITVVKTKPAKKRD